MNVLMTGGLADAGAPLAGLLRKRGEDLRALERPHHHGLRSHDRALAEPANRVWGHRETETFEDGIAKTIASQREGYGVER